MAKWLQKIEAWIGGGQGGGIGRLRTFRMLIILALIGIAIMLFNSFVNVKKVESENVGREPPQQSSKSAFQTDSTNENNPFEGIESDLEESMKEILEKIVGVGTVDVMVTVDSTEEIVVQRNVTDSQQLTDENDASGGKRHTTQFTRDGQIVTYEVSGDQTPIITKKLKPQVRGVLVVAKGAENKVVKGLIVDAVEKGLNVPAYRISVVPRKQSD
ncbi:stage III sporulation protein AG [Paenibacillus sediminis]|uniref:Stage III sporulation protein AG n=1 Tax=Paenibacillus sediminis TaxID=664909 RepID=A0ABS4GZG2_9BACL|nr:stage III sporulation protein AG [Paenibacillus sediminis]MBP1935655.1 stage III sporulation protein AG [Paenibacillus sediminis]